MKHIVFILFLLTYEFVFSQCMETKPILMINRKVQFENKLVVQVLDSFMLDSNSNYQYEIFWDRIHPFYTIFTFQAINLSDTTHRQPYLYFFFKGRKINLFSGIEGCFADDSLRNSMFTNRIVKKRWNLVLKWDTVKIFKNNSIPPFDPLTEPAPVKFSLPENKSRWRK